MDLTAIAFSLALNSSVAVVAIESDIPLDMSNVTCYTLLDSNLMPEHYCEFPLYKPQKLEPIACDVSL